MIYTRREREKERERKREIVFERLSARFSANKWHFVNKTKKKSATFFERAEREREMSSSSHVCSLCLNKKKYSRERD